MKSYTSYATTVINPSAVWVNKDNALVEDGNVALWPPSANIDSAVLDFGGFVFGIPNSERIVGILVEAKCAASAGSEAYYAIDRTCYALYVGNAPPALLAESHPAAQDLGGSLAWIGIGGSSDRWGREWKAAEINSGLDLTVHAIDKTHDGFAASMTMDSVRITVYTNGGARGDDCCYDLEIGML